MRFALAIGRPPICAAGATWTSRTTSAPWAARYGHTSVIDAAGAIYVIGGFSGTTYYKDVWGSTNGGEHRTRGDYSRGRQGVRRGVLRGYSRGLRGTTGSAVYSVGPGGLPDTRTRAHARTRALPAPHMRMQKLAHAHAHTLGRMHTHAHM